MEDGEKRVLIIEAVEDWKKANECKDLEGLEIVDNEEGY